MILSWTIVSFGVCFWNASKVLIIFLQSALFSLFKINVAPSPVQAEKSVLAVERGPSVLKKSFLDRILWNQAKEELYFSNKIMWHCVSERILKCEWAAVFQVLSESEPTGVPSTTSKNSMFYVSWRWWNFVTLYRCSSFAVAELFPVLLLLYLTTVRSCGHFYSSTEKWTYFCPWDLRTKP